MNLHARVYQLAGLWQVDLWVMIQRVPGGPTESVGVGHCLIELGPDLEDPHPLAQMLGALVMAAQVTDAEFASTRGSGDRGPAAQL